MFFVTLVIKLPDCTQIGQGLLFQAPKKLMVLCKPLMFFVNHSEVFIRVSIWLLVNK